MNENTICSNPWDTMKAALREKFEILSAYKVNQRDD